MGALSLLTRKWCLGELPPHHARPLCASSLTPLKKADGGVRPVAVGDCLRRLVGKCLLATGVVKAQVASLQPVQVGVGTQGVVEAVALATATLVRAYRGSADWVILNVDLRNAFYLCGSADNVEELCGACTSTVQLPVVLLHWSRSLSPRREHH